MTRGGLMIAQGMAAPTEASAKALLEKVRLQSN